MLVGELLSIGKRFILGDVYSDITRVGVGGE